MASDDGCCGISRGFAMIELLVALFIIAFGALGLLGLQTRAMQSEVESYQRAQALVTLHDIVDRMTANRDAAACYVTTNLAAPYLGKDGTAPSSCPGGSYTPDQANRAVADLTAWHNALLGSGETSGATRVGAMSDGRGCVTVAPTFPTPGVLPTYTVAVVWKGIGDTAAPTNTCGQNLYGSEAQRRVVSISLQFARLTSP